MKISELKLFKNKAEATGLLLFLTLAVLPLVLGIIYALLYSLGVIGLVSDGFTTIYWQRILSDYEFWLSIGYTFYIALVTIGITIILALFLALYFRGELRSGLPGFAIYVPLAFPAIVVAFLGFQLLSQSGLLARIAFQLGLIATSGAFPDLVNDPFGIGIITAHTFMAAPFFTLYFMNLYKHEKISEFRQVSESLGASPFAQLRRIVIPMLLKRAFPTLTLYTIFVMGSYEIPLILGRQSPQMLSVLAVRKLRRFSLSTIPEAYIAAIVFIAIIVAVLAVLFKSKNFSYDLDR